MDDIVYLNCLYDNYKTLLTDKQCRYFEDYYFDNLSLQEMSELYEISRSAIHKQLMLVLEKLKEYEDKLKVYEKNNKIKEIAEKLLDEKMKKELLKLI